MNKLMELDKIRQEAYEEGYLKAISDILFKELDIEKLESLACTACGSKVESLMKKKGGEGIYPRYLIFYHLRRIKSLPHKIEEIAIRYGLSRTTPYHAIKRADELVQSNDFLFNGYLREFNKLIATL